MRRHEQPAGQPRARSDRLMSACAKREVNER
jgi:hypothetical protein